MNNNINNRITHNDHSDHHQQGDSNFMHSALAHGVLHNGCIGRFSVVSQLLVISLAAIAYTIAANVTIDFYPVPFTLQTMVLLILVLFNNELALMSTGVYVLAGLLGAPVFAGWANGLMVLSSPSAGYIIGIFLAPVVVYASNIRYSVLKIILTLAVVFICGVSYLSSIMGIKAAFYNGFVFFVFSEAIKTAIAYAVYRFIVKKA